MDPQTKSPDPALTQGATFTAPATETLGQVEIPAELRHAGNTPGNMRPPPGAPKPDTNQGISEEQPRRSLAEVFAEMDRHEPALGAFLRRVNFIVEKWHGNEQVPK